MTTQGPHLLEVKWLPGETATIDGEIKGHITELSITERGRVKYLVEWFCNGCLQSAWFHEQRLS